MLFIGDFISVTYSNVHESRNHIINPYINILQKQKKKKNSQTFEIIHCLPKVKVQSALLFSSFVHKSSMNELR